MAAHHRSRRGSGLCCLIFALGLASAAVGAQGNATPPPPAASPATAAVDARSQQQLKELDARIAQAKLTLSQIETWGPVLSTVGLWISVLSMVVVVLSLVFGGAAWAIGGRLTRANRDARAIRERLKSLRTQFDEALGEMERRFSELPPSSLVGDRSLHPPQGALDADILVIVGDRLALREDRRTLAAALVTVGSYWRKFHQFDRSIERLHRALELNPASAAAHQALARTLWNALAAEKLHDDAPRLDDRQQHLFDQALLHIDRARRHVPSSERERSDILYDLGAIHFAARDLPTAARYMKQAADASQAEAKLAGREPDWDCCFALACVYARQQRFNEALELLKVVAEKRKRWDRDENKEVAVDYRKWAYDEADFEKWFALPDWADEILAVLGPRPTPS